MRRWLTRGAIVAIVVVGTLAWLVWLTSAPILPSPLAAGAYGLGSFICHQRPERSFHLAGAQLPVCARCIGIYFGAAVASLGFLRRGVWGPARNPLRLFILAAIPTALTLAVEWTGVWVPSNILRAGAGVLLGLAAAFVVIGALTTLHYDECAPRRPIAPRPPRASI